MNPNGISYAVAYEGMQCVDETHVDGCPCHAGGDVEYRTYPPCFICRRDTDSTSVRVDYGRTVETVCDSCYSKRDEDYLDERLDMTDGD